MAARGSISSVGNPVIYIAEVDNILKAISNYGKKWLYTTYLILGISSGFPTAWHMFAISFVGGLPDDYHCRVGANQSIPQIYKDGKWTNDKCRMYKNESSGDNQTIPCNNGWVYYTDYQSTIVTEWDLVCDRDYLPQMSQTIFVVGTLIGAGSLSPLADWLGRKKVHIGSQIAMAVVGIVTMFSPNYAMYAVMRFLSGALQQGVVLSASVQIFELFPASTRTVFSLMVQFYWAVGVIFLAVFAFFVRDWRYLQLVISIPAFLVLLGIWFFPESVPWLIAHGKTDEAEKVIEKAVKGTKIKIPIPGSLLEMEVPERPSLRRLSLELKNKSVTQMRNLKRRLSDPRRSSTQAPPAPPPEEKAETLLDVIKHPRLRWYSLIMCLMWLNSSMAYYGISLSATTLVGNRYLNFGLVGVVEIPAYCFTIAAATKIGRRIPSCFVQVGGGVALIIVAFIPKTLADGTSLAPLIVTVTMVGMFFEASAFSLAFLYGQEIYPTSTRNSGLGLSSMWARAGGMLAPFAGYMMTKIYWFPGVFLGSVSIIIGLLVLYLPEPLGRPIPQKIADMDSWTRQRYRPPTDDNMADEQLPALHEQNEDDLMEIK
ncbi:organic cation transporter protein-like [Tubulanus polymorphus]|uniref:organic cation transporter protein-like n=1 Tax=Tubulanus polymorphus TaxID=672921 RepID=UPI003DA1F4FF